MAVFVSLSLKARNFEGKQLGWGSLGPLRFAADRFGSDRHLVVAEAGPGVAAGAVEYFGVSGPLERFVRAVRNGGAG